MRRILVLSLVASLAGSVSRPGFAQDPTALQPLPSVNLPPALDRVLRDYERAWQARDAAGLAALFTEDGMTLSNNNNQPPRRPPPG